MKIKLKVCGLREYGNINALLEIEPEFMGLIFYPASPRFVSEKIPKKSCITKRVGVFVNSTVETIRKMITEYDLDLVQLHGEETVDFTRQMKELGVDVIKVFSINDHMPLEQMEPYLNVADYFMFDTKTKKYGGSGEHFDWSVLKDYPWEKPFFLSGGIEPNDLETIKSLEMESLFAVDVNSRFELTPGVKDIPKIRAFKQRL